MTAADAPGVADLVRRTYGDTYGHARIYQPEDFFADQEAGLHTSEVVIADNGEGEVVGHCAFTFHGPKVAEGGMVITDERYRGHGIASRMEANLMARIVEREIKWVMAEPSIIHTASQEMIIGHSDQGAITGVRLKEFTHFDLDAFADHMERDRISVAVGFIPLAEMQAHDVWIAPEYAEILEIVLAPVDWPRQLITEMPSDHSLPDESTLSSDFDEAVMKAAIEVEVIGADLAEAVEAERDALAAKGAKFIEVHIPTNEPSAATASLIDHGFSFAGFLPEMRGHTDLLLLQWIADPRIERDKWALLNDHLERLADAIVDQAHLAAERR